MRPDPIPQVRLLALLPNGPSSLDTIAITLELLAAGASDNQCALSSRLEEGGASSSYPLPCIAADCGGGSGGGDTSSDSRVGDGEGEERREGWRRAGASAAERCLVEIGLLCPQVEGRKDGGGEKGDYGGGRDRGRGRGGVGFFRVSA